VRTEQCVRPVLTYSSSDSRSSLPHRSSIEAILHPQSNATTASSLADPRLASARNWTTVIDSTSLLVSILSSWTTHEYSYYHYLDRDAFLDDMASGRTDFCSELLVNALLATACVSNPGHDYLSLWSLLSAYRGRLLAQRSKIDQNLSRTTQL
jgi:hypothetical protein